jgi:hypothetical protein
VGVDRGECAGGRQRWQRRWESKGCAEQALQLVGNRHEAPGMRRPRECHCCWAAACLEGGRRQGRAAFTAPAHIHWHRPARAPRLHSWH